MKFTHDPATRTSPEDPSYVQERATTPGYRADLDALWLFPHGLQVNRRDGRHRLSGRGDPFANRTKAPVYEHLKRALDFIPEAPRAHGMPAGSYAGTGIDCLRLGANGESSFVAFPVLLRLHPSAPVRAPEGDGEYLAWLEPGQTALRERLITKMCWDVTRVHPGLHRVR